MSLRMDFKVEGLDELVRDFERAGGHTDGLLRAALTNSANRGQTEIRRRAAHRTGTLQRSVLTEIFVNSAEIAVNEKYGIWIEEGTGIFGPRHTPIVPRNAKALVFKPKGGGIVFAKKVSGMRPKPFFKPGYEAAQPYMYEQFEKVTDILVKGLAGKGFSA